MKLLLVFVSESETLWRSIMEDIFLGNVSNGIFQRWRQTSTHRHFESWNFFEYKNFISNKFDFHVTFNVISPLELSFRDN